MNTKSLDIPTLRFPNFLENWKLLRLDQVAEISRGKSKHRPRDAAFLYGGEYPFVQTGDIRNANLYLDTYSQTYSEAGLKQSKLWDEGTLCITIAANIAETAILKIKACFPDSIIGLMPLREVADTLFIKYQFDKFKINIQRTSEGNAQANLNQEKLSNIKFPFPSLPEQQKIAQFLKAIDAKIELLIKKKSLLEQYKQGIIQQIFSQQLRFKDEDGNDFSDWEEKILEEILIEHKSRNKENTYKEVFSVAKEKGVINQIEHLGRSYASEDTSNYKVVNDGDVIYTKSPTSDFPFGIIKQNKLGRTGIVSILYGVFRPSNRYLGTLLDYYFSSGINTYNYLVPLVEKGAKNTMNISNDAFLNGRALSMPSSLKEQQKIVNFLSIIDTKIEIEESYIQVIKIYKKGLLQQLFI